MKKMTTKVNDIHVTRRRPIFAIAKLLVRGFEGGAFYPRCREGLNTNMLQSLEASNKQFGYGRDRATASHMNVIDFGGHFFIILFASFAHVLPALMLY